LFVRSKPVVRYVPYAAIAISAIAMVCFAIGFLDGRRFAG
jgi:hypothetical protein